MEAIGDHAFATGSKRSPLLKREPELSSPPMTTIAVAVAGCTLPDCVTDT